MRILSSGQLIVGGTDYGYAGTDLQVGNTSDSQNGLNILTSTTGYGYVLFGDGLANADSYVGQISYKHGDDYMAFRTAGTEKIRITSSGEVGIGTTSPPKNLTVVYSESNTNKSNTLGGAAEGSGLLIHNSASVNGSYANLDFRSDTADGRILYSYNGTSNSGDFHFITDNTASFGTKLFIGDSGDVGIGTTTPASKLEVAEETANTTAKITVDSASWDASLSLKNANGTWEIYNDYTGLGTTGALAFWNGSYRMVIDNTGKVGIGNTSPASKLHIGTYPSSINSSTLPTTPSNYLITLTPPSTTNYYGGGIGWSEGTNVAASINTYDAGSGGALGLVFSTGNNTTLSEALRIDSAGRVGIGVTPSSAELEVNGHFAATTKSFIIDNPKTGGKLQYGVVESDQHSVFVRGKNDTNLIELPEEWEWLVDPDSVTVQLTSIGQIQSLFVISQDNKKIKIGGLATSGQYNYTVYGERVDVDKLQKHLK